MSFNLDQLGKKIISLPEKSSIDIIDDIDTSYLNNPFDSITKSNNNNIDNNINNNINNNSFITTNINSSTPKNTPIPSPVKLSENKSDFDNLIGNKKISVISSNNPSDFNDNRNWGLFGSPESTNITVKKDESDKLLNNSPSILLNKFNSIKPMDNLKSGNENEQLSLIKKLGSFDKISLPNNTITTNNSNNNITSTNNNSTSTINTGNNNVNINTSQSSINVSKPIENIIKESKNNDIRMSKEDEMKEKQDLIFKLQRMKKKGVPISKNYTLDHSLLEIKEEFLMIKKEKELQQSIKLQSNLTINLVKAIEYINGEWFNFLEIELDGWSDSFEENISEYDDIFEELHEQHGHLFRTNPIFRYIGGITLSGIMYHQLKHRLNKFRNSTKFNNEKSFADNLHQNDPNVFNFLNTLGANFVNNNNTNDTNISNNFNNKINNSNLHKNENNITKEHVQNGDNTVPSTNDILKQMNNIRENYKKNGTTSKTKTLSEGIKLSI